MPSTTPNLNLNTPPHGTPNWDALLNTNFVLLDSYLSGGSTLGTLKLAALSINNGPLLQTTAQTGTGSIVLGSSPTIDSPTLTGVVAYPAGGIPTAALAANAATQAASAVITSDFSTSNTSPTDVTGATVTMVTTGGPVLVMMSGPGHSVTQLGSLRLNRDGSDSTVVASFIAGGQVDLPWSVVTLYNPTAGSHTFKLRAQVISGGTMNLRFSNATGTLVVMELKR